MKKIFLLPVAILLVVLGACTRNNGDIGPWFGTWRLDRMVIDGVTDTTYTGNLFFLFQSQVFCARTIYPHHLYSDSWARWSSEDDDRILIIDYNNSDNLDDGENSSFYRPPKMSRLKNGINRLTVERITSTSMQLTLPDGIDDERVEYHLSKFH